MIEARRSKSAAVASMVVGGHEGGEMHLVHVPVVAECINKLLSRVLGLRVGEILNPKGKSQVIGRFDVLKHHSNVPIMDEVVLVGSESVRQVFWCEEHMSMLAIESLLDDTPIAEYAAKYNVVNLVVKAEL